jgi:hypothetical protein
MSFKTFQQRLRALQENPQINTFFTKDNMEAGIEKLKTKLAAVKSRSIGNSNFYYKDHDGHHYFHKTNGIPHEYSRMNNNNVQNYIVKGSGEVKHIVHHMKHHIKEHGELLTDAQQSVGAKHLWVKFIKSKPKGVKFEAKINGKKLPIDHTNIDNHVDHLWNKTDPASYNIIRAYATKEHDSSTKK